jgi:glycosyltransferase involved in cell wall biosynthesis
VGVTSISSPIPRLILLTPHDPNDVGTWSGTAHSAYRALLRSSAGVEVVHASWTDGLIKGVTRLLRRVGVRTDYTRSGLYASAASTEVSVRLRFATGEVIVAIAAAPYVSGLRTTRPVIFVSDATFASISRIYSVYAALPQRLKADADRVEHEALHRSDHIVFSSEWAKASAISDYGVAPATITVLPLGPNISSELIDRFRTTKSADFRGGVRLLFIGADWNRKGGPVVLEIKQHLESRGIGCECFFVGNSPENLPVGNGIHVVGPLDKSDDKQLHALCRLYELAHFFVLPTTAEAFGVVFSEAQAFGCPSLAYAVGGTPTAILDGVTGFTLPLGASAADFAEKICTLVRDPREYEKMSVNCRARYETEASWNVWAGAVVHLASQLRERRLHSSIAADG